MDNACVVGYGMVGKATAEVFGIKKYLTRHSETSSITMEEAANCKFIFICLPTPVDQMGRYFVDDIKKAIRELLAFGTSPVFIIRSTVYPGFADEAMDELGYGRIVSNPEFLSEDTAVEDMKNPPFIVIGAKNGFLLEDVSAVYSARIKGAPIMTTNNVTAEMLKLTLNTFFALKVIFANQVFDACKKNGANYETVKNALEAHPFGSKNHFKIWYKGKRGVNGHCLPKDSKAFGNYTLSPLILLASDLNKLYTTEEENDSTT